MRRRVLGRSGPRVPVIGQGTYRLEQVDRRVALRALRAGFDAGLLHVDTAELYGRGRVERLVGQALRGVRDEVFVVSKVRPPRTSYRAVIRSCERSLRRLRTDRIDLFLLHWLGEDPLEETLAAFERLQAAGKILQYGVSNFTLKDLRRAVKLVGPGRIACNQVAYSLSHRQPERDLLPYCREEGIALVAYSPLGSGAFPSPSSPGGRVLQQIADAHGATPRQVALAFLLQHPSVFAIPKQAQPRHAAENAEAGDLLLSSDERERLEAAFPVGARERPPSRRERNWKGKLVEAAKSAWRRWYTGPSRPVLVPIPVR